MIDIDDARVVIALVFVIGILVQSEKAINVYEKTHSGECVKVQVNNQQGEQNEH